MRKLAIFLLSLPSIAFAAAGFADAYYDHQQWIFPAYAYCLVFGLIILFSLVTVSLIYKTKARYISEHISAYLIKHRILAIIIAGILLAIPIGIIGSVSPMLTSASVSIIGVSRLSSQRRQSGLAMPFATEK